MQIMGKYGKEDIALLYIAKINENIVEFVESIQPPLQREKKWVLIVSSSYGCPIGCKFCDAGGYYHGNMSAEEIISEIRYMTQNRFPDNNIPCEKFKIQFARMGEPALNSEVLKVLEQLPKIYNAPGLMPCISTVAPKGGEEFLSKLITIKDQNYPSGNFQLQFSIHSTNEENRHEIMSPKIWNLEEISEYGKNWFKGGDRKITLNFALTEESIIEIDVLKQYFDPGLFFIKLTPLNPTNSALKNGYKSGITKENAKSLKLVSELRNTGYDAIVSIGEWKENEIGTNCGQFATELVNGKLSIKPNYTTSNYPF